MDSEFKVAYQNKTTFLGVSEQLYTARGSQGIALNEAQWPDLSPNKELILTLFQITT